MSYYRQAFGLRSEPFHVTPDPAFLFLTPQHREALAGLAYAISERKGFAILTGPAGTGKTTLARKVLQGTHASAVESSVVLNPALSVAEFLEAVLLDFGIREIPASKAQRIWIFQKFLLNSHRQGRVAALLVDEAHKMTPELIEEVRLWSNFEFGDEKLLQIILVGQKELLNVIERPELGQFKQRIVLRLALGPLEKSEVGAYLRHRWAKAGGGDTLPFAEEAVERIAYVSGGIPRVINTVADNALLLAFGQGAATVEATHITGAAMELGLPLAFPKVVVIPPPPDRAAHSLRTLESYGSRPGWWSRFTARTGRLAGSRI
ncbi:MAG TPA: AAA family ATPase [Bryobacteraceae bacterium]|nr:AAA family ATPase [Bryobacteraceae bacterium]